MNVCAIEDCGRSHRSGGLCGLHDRRLKLYGSPTGSFSCEKVCPGCACTFTTKFARKEYCDSNCRHRHWNAQDRERSREYSRRHAKKHHAKRRAVERERYAANREQAVARVAEYNRRNRDKHCDVQATRRARKRAQFAERIYRRVVFDRDGGVCHICGGDVDPTNWHLDHVTPLAKGGAHTYANVAVAHPVCNMRKGGR